LKSHKRSVKMTRIRETKDFEIEQEIVRTERIKTKVTKRKEIPFDNIVYEVLQRFDARAARAGPFIDYRF